MTEHYSGRNPETGCALTALIAAALLVLIIAAVIIARLFLW